MYEKKGFITMGLKLLVILVSDTSNFNHKGSS